MSAKSHTTPSSTPPPSPPGRRPIVGHALRTLSLALPVMIARLGLILMVTVDSIMAGRASESALAHYGIAMAPHIFLLVVGIGLLVGTVILVGQADGAGRPKDCGAIWHRALIIAAALGGVWSVILLFGEPILLLFGQTPEMAAGGGQALAWFAPGMPAILMYVATSFFLEGIGRARAGMVIALSANIPNAALNWLLIEGQLGMPEMGAAGATLATTIARWLMLAAILVYVLHMTHGERYGVRIRHAAGWRTVKRLLRLGTPLSIATGMEAGAFAMIATFAGRMGESEMAAYQATINVIAFGFMLAIGLSTATSVRVANAVGRGDREGLALAGWLGLALALAMMVILSAILFTQRDLLALLYSDSGTVQALIRMTLVWAGVIVLFDGAQAVLMGAHRGLADVVVPTVLQGIAFWGIGVPLAYTLGLAAGWGLTGVMGAILVALCAASIFLTVRFAVVSRRPPSAAFA